MLRSISLTVLLLITSVIAGLAPAHAQTSPTTEVAYFLPWTQGEVRTVNQRPGGNFSHRCPGRSCFAYDFRGEGWEVRASAPGVIVSVDRGRRGQTGRGGPGNNIKIRHADGTCTRYLHMASGTIPANLDVGSEVNQAQPLGLTGNTGYTRPLGRGYHLHFSRANCDTNASIAVEFVEFVPNSGSVVMSLNSATGAEDTFSIMADADGSIVRLYEATFDRQPDLTGFVYWLNIGLDLDRMAALFMLSDEWRLTYGNLDNEAFVTTVYQNVLGRAPDTEGAEYWRQIVQQEGRAVVLIGFSESDEFKNLTETG